MQTTTKTATAHCPCCGAGTPVSPRARKLLAEGVYCGKLECGEHREAAYQAALAEHRARQAAAGPRRPRQRATVMGEWGMACQLGRIGR